MPVFVGEAEHADAAADTAGFEAVIDNADIGDLQLALDERGVDPQHARLGIGEPRVKTTKAAGGESGPLEVSRAGLDQLFVEVPQVDPRNPFVAVAFEGAAAVPDRMAAAAAIFRALPNNPDATAESRFVIGPHNFEHFEPIAEFQPFDRRGCRHVDAEFQDGIVRSEDVPHHRSARQLPIRRPEVGIAGEELCFRRKIGTDIEHCTIYRDNLVEDNNNLTAPTNSSTAIAPWGVGVEFPGVYGDAVEGNTIKGNVNDGFLGFEYPNPYEPPEFKNTIFFGFSGVKVADNTFEENGSTGGPYARDIMFQGGFFTPSPNDCAIGNTTPDGTQPADLEGEWSCDNATTPSPNGGEAALGWVEQLSYESSQEPGEPQPAPEPQQTMPNPCEGVPTNPLCE